MFAEAVIPALMRPTVDAVAFTLDEKPLETLLVPVAPIDVMVLVAFKPVLLVTGAE